MIQMKIRKVRIYVLIRQTFLHMVFLHAIFRKARGAYAQAAIQRSLSKEVVLESRQNPSEIIVRELMF